MIESVISNVTRYAKHPLFLRDCLFYEAYCLGRIQGPPSVVTSLMLVGVIEAPLLSAVAVLAGECLVGPDADLRGFLTARDSGPATLYFLLGVVALEVASFGLFGRGRKIMSRLDGESSADSRHARRLGVAYAVLALAAGVVASVLIYL